MRHGRLALEAGELSRAHDSAKLARFFVDGGGQRRFVEECRGALDSYSDRLAMEADELDVAGDPEGARLLEGRARAASNAR